MVARVVSSQKHQSAKGLQTARQMPAVTTNHNDLLEEAKNSSSLKDCAHEARNIYYRLKRHKENDYPSLELFIRTIKRDLQLYESHDLLKTWATEVLNLQFSKTSEIKQRTQAETKKLHSSRSTKVDSKKPQAKSTLFNELRSIDNFPDAVAVYSKLEDTNPRLIKAAWISAKHIITLLFHCDNMNNGTQKKEILAFGHFKNEPQYLEKLISKLCCAKPDFEEILQDSILWKRSLEIVYKLLRNALYISCKKRDNDLSHLLTKDDTFWKNLQILSQKLQNSSPPPSPPAPLPKPAPPKPPITFLFPDIVNKLMSNANLKLKSQDLMFKLFRGGTFLQREPNDSFESPVILQELCKANPKLDSLINKYSFFKQFPRNAIHEIIHQALQIATKPQTTDLKAQLLNIKNIFGNNLVKLVEILKSQEKES